MFFPNLLTRYEDVLLFSLYIKYVYIYLLAAQRQKAKDYGPGLPENVTYHILTT